MPAAVIVEALRSPMGKGKPGGALSRVNPVDLLAQLLVALVESTGIDPGTVEDVVIGCVTQVSEQSATPGRWAWLAAGLPEHVPSVTIDRRCGSGQQAFQFGVQAVMAGAQEAVVVGGVESMSRVPMGSNRQDANPFGAAADRYAPGLVPQGISAELVAARWNLTRADLDAYAARSHRLAAEAAAGGAFNEEIVPIRTVDADGTETVITADETIRPATTADKLAALRPAFESIEIGERFPEITWSITAGNSSQLTDGASVLLVTSEAYAERHGLTPLARYCDGALSAEDPILMLTAPISATEKLLQRTGRKLEDIDHYEVNEAFASVPLAWQHSLSADPSRLNPRGGAIALGHPLGASGARLLTTAVQSLRATAGRYALVTMCEAGGMANASLIERL
jgi:acetyl-CoA acetyltransferase family protein